MIKTPKVCMVIGTGQRGILKLAMRAIKATERTTRKMSRKIFFCLKRAL
jgi:hypothetical protein